MDKPPLRRRNSRTIVIALFKVTVGVFGPGQAFSDQFLGSAKAAGEKMWAFHHGVANGSTPLVKYRSTLGSLWPTDWHGNS